MALDHGDLGDLGEAPLIEVAERVLRPLPLHRVVVPDLDDVGFVFIQHLVDGVNRLEGDVQRVVPLRGVTRIEREFDLFPLRRHGEGTFAGVDGVLAPHVPPRPFHQDGLVLALPQAGSGVDVKPQIVLVVGRVGIVPVLNQELVAARPAPGAGGNVLLHALSGPVLVGVHDVVGVVGVEGLRRRCGGVDVVRYVGSVRTYGAGGGAFQNRGYSKKVGDTPRLLVVFVILRSVQVPSRAP